MAKIKVNSISAGVPLAEEPVAATPPPVALPEVSAPTPAPEPQAPLRPGLETPAAPAAQNPFTTIHRWGKDNSDARLTAMEVPGGCLVKSQFAIPGLMGEAICFVPDVIIEDGELKPGFNSANYSPPESEKKKLVSVQKT